MKKPIVLIIGAGGFTGKYFLEYVRACPAAGRYSFVAADTVFPFRPFCRSIILDASDTSALSSLLKRLRPDYIVNFSSVFAAPDLASMLKVNSGIPLALLEHCRESGVRRALFVGSAAEYGFPAGLPVLETVRLAPLSPYGLSKAEQAGYVEYFARVHGVNAVLARTFNISGAGLSERLSLGSFAAQIKHARDGGTISAGNVDARRDYLDIRDVCAAYWKLLMKGRAGEVYNVCAGKSYTIKSLLDAMIRASGKRLSISVRKSRMRKTDLRDIYGSNVKLKKHTGWRPSVDIMESVSSMVAE